MKEQPPKPVRDPGFCSLVLKKKENGWKEVAGAPYLSALSAKMQTGAGPQQRDTEAFSRPKPIAALIINF